MALKTVVGQKIINEVIKAVKEDTGAQSWKVRLRVEEKRKKKKRKKKKRKN